MILKANTLKERGLPESSIRQFCHMEGSPFFQKKPGGTWWYETERFEKFLDKLAKEKD